MDFLKAYFGYSRVGTVDREGENVRSPPAEVAMTISASPAVASNPTLDKRCNTAVISVKGMTCASCSGAVENALSALKGVSKASVALLQEAAEVQYDPALISSEALVEAVEDAGFDGALISVKQPKLASRIEVVRLQVLGMTCAVCSGAVERALMQLKGVSRATVSLTQAAAEVHLDTAVVQPADIVEAVEDAGFEAKLISSGGVESVHVKVTGMTCGACSSSVESALAGSPGVTKAAVNHVTGMAEVSFDSSVIGPRHIVAIIEDCGFGAEACAPGSMTTSPSAAIEEELAQWWTLLSYSLMFTVPTFILAMVLPVVPGTDLFRESMVFGFPCVTLLKWILVTPVQFIIGARFYRGSYKSLRRGTANMDVLVAMGTTASYVYSVTSVMHHHFSQHHENSLYRPTDFFETSAMIITLILMGKYLECAAKGKTSEAITKLMRLTPETATVVVLDATGCVVSSQEVACHLIHKGDILKVLPGARIPTDGIVVSGESYINEAMITGEPKPVWKTSGDAVIGGTVTGGSSMLLMTATRVGSETTLSQIVRLVQQAQMAKAPVQAFADKVSAIFVPVVIALAMITWFTWFICGLTSVYPTSWLPMGHTPFLFALLFGIAVMVIACPCALGLATPTAVMVGTGVAASLGILIKGGDALEHASEVDVVVFDKTGTLTLGHPSVLSCQLLDDGLSMGQLCRLMGAAESASEHPLARAVLDYATRSLSGVSSLGPASPASSPALPVSFSATSLGGGQLSPSHMAEQDTPLLPSSDSPGQGQLRARTRSWSGVQPTGSSAAVAVTAVPASPGVLFPAAQDVQVVQGMGVCCWVNADAAQLTHAQVSRFSRLLEAARLRSAAVGDRKTSGGGAAAGAGAGAGSSPGSSGTVSLHVDAKGHEGMVPVMVGNRQMMVQNGVRLPEGLEEMLVPEELRGHTCVLVAVGGCLVALLSIADPLKPEAAAVVAALQAAGVSCCMLTGDNRRTANAVAAQLHVDAVFAEVLPAEKAQVVRDLQLQGHIVAMIGDGINDSPALAAANVGMAIGSGTDIAIEAANYVLMRNTLEDVVTALDVSRCTLQRIKLNYFWAMVYNVVMIPVAAGVQYPFIQVQLPPMLAGACMAFSSVSVVMSSLLLRRYKRPVIPDLKAGAERGRAPPRSGKLFSAVGAGADIQEEDADVEEGSKLLPGRGGGSGRRKIRAAGMLPKSLGRLLGRNKRLAGEDD